MHKKIILLLSICLLLAGGLVAQEDTRYDAGLNLPFNEQAGDVNPQTGSLSISAADVTLPGRGGKHFSFGRIWSLNQANVYNMYADPYDGGNRLNSNTVEKYNNMGVGWNTTLPYIYEDNTPSTYISPLYLFFGGSVFELDRSMVSGETNILYYDLEDMRVQGDGSISYGDFTLYELTGLQATYDVADSAGDNSEYLLTLKDNSKYYFREDGKLLMEEDFTGRNRIWYFYNADGKLCLVVDTIGRKIGFAYNADGNLETIEWEITRGVKTGETRSRITETRSIRYKYESALGFAEVNNLGSTVTDFTEPYILTGFINPEGNETRYEYSEGTAPFSYNSSITHAANVYMLLTSITSMHTDDGNYKARRCFEYEIPAKGMYEKRFYTNGYMKYYRITQEYNINRHGNTVNNTSYIYYENGEAGNYNQYTTLVEQGNVRTTYTYTISGEESRNNVLDSILVETNDGFTQLSEFTYNTDRAKTLEKVQRMGQFIYEERFEYDRKGNLRRYTDKMGLKGYLEYDEKYSVPLLETKTLKKDNREVTYRARSEINESGQVTKQTVYLGDRAVDVARITYDEVYGNPVAQTDAHGNTVHTVYDEDYHTFPVKIYQDVSIASWTGGGNVHDNWQTSPDGTKKVRIRSWKVFNTDGSIWMELDNEGFAVEHYYDKNGTEIETVIPDANDFNSFALPIELDEYGNPSGEDFNNFLSSDVYTDGTFLASRVNNPGIRIEIDYQNDFVKTYTDIEVDADTGIRDEKITGAQGDGLGNVEEEIEYDAFDAVYAVKKMQYDDLGRMVSLTDPDRGYDIPDFTIHGVQIERYERTWMIRYDDLGRQVRVFYPETRAGKTDVKRITYNDYENSATTTDPERRQVYERMDWNGNLVEVIAGANEEKLVYRYEYDQLNRKVSFTDPRGIVTEYKYDERDLLVEQFYGKDSGSDFMSYNDLGQLVMKTDRKGQVLTFTYDEMARNTSVDHFDRNNTLVRRVETAYDNRGNAVRIESESLVEHYVYDNANRVVSLERLLNNTDPGLEAGLLDIWEGYDTNKVFSFQYQYNAAGLVTGMVYPDGSVHRYTYDPVHARLEEIAEGEDELSVMPFVTALTYSLSGVVTRMDYANSTWQEWEFDNRKRISGIKITGPSGIIEDLTYTLNGSGDILAINDNEYEYDEFDRIVGAKTRLPGNTDSLKDVEAHFGTYDDPGFNNGIPYLPEADLNADGRINGFDHHLASLQDEGDVYDIESFEYDENGNRTKLVQNGDEYTYTYGKRNRLLSISVRKKGEYETNVFAEYEYDENGNTTRRTIYKEEGTQVIEFEYDTMNRLVKTTEDTGETVYYYDNAGNRFIKKGPEGDITLYLRHGQIAVAMDVEIRGQVSGDGVQETGKINRYVLSGDLLAGRITRTFYTDDSVSTARSWYHLDHLNSTKCITDEVGVVEVNYVYRAFGEQLRKLGEGDAKYTYGGKELDGDTNLYYFNARYYDATIGRFINVDPIQDGTNWYVYCANNPLSMMDPTGLQKYTVIIYNIDPTPGKNEIAAPYYNTTEREWEAIVGHTWMEIIDSSGAIIGIYGWGHDGSGDPKDGGTVPGALLDDDRKNHGRSNATGRLEISITEGEKDQLQEFWKNLKDSGTKYSYGGKNKYSDSTFCTEAVIDALNYADILTSAQNAILDSYKNKWGDEYPAWIPNDPKLNSLKSDLADNTSSNPNDFQKFIEYENGGSPF